MTYQNMLNIPKLAGLVHIVEQFCCAFFGSHVSVVNSFLGGPPDSLSPTAQLVYFLC